jgi:hypothetical protein
MVPSRPFPSAFWYEPGRTNDVLDRLTNDKGPDKPAQHLQHQKSAAVPVVLSQADVRKDSVQVGKRIIIVASLVALPLVVLSSTKWGRSWYTGIPWSVLSESVMDGKVQASHINSVEIYYLPYGSPMVETLRGLDQLPHVLVQDRETIDAFVDGLAYAGSARVLDKSSTYNRGVLRVNFDGGQTAFLYWRHGTNDVWLTLPHRSNEFGTTSALIPRLDEWFDRLPGPAQKKPK